MAKRNKRNNRNRQPIRVAKNTTMGKHLKKLVEQDLETRDERQEQQVVSSPVGAADYVETSTAKKAKAGSQETGDRNEENYQITNHNSQKHSGVGGNTMQQEAGSPADAEAIAGRQELGDSRNTDQQGVMNNKEELVASSGIESQTPSWPSPDRGRENTDWRVEKHYVEMKDGTQLTGIREKLFKDRYSMKDDSGQSMEMYPEQMWARVAWAVAQVESTEEKKQEWEKKFYEAMLDFKFLPAGRFLTSAGTGTDTTMINCFVIPSPEDTRQGIIKTLEHVTEISARGGGVGFNLSSLRPRGSYLQSINGTSSGAVSWANLYSVAAHDIIQQGGTRRGALMIMLWDWHPDVEEFITVKEDMQKILGANLSVCVSDAFMEAVKQDADWALVYPDTEYEAYRDEWRGDLEGWKEAGYPVKTYKTIKARELWDKICTSAWKSAEPGVVFMDRYNEMNNTWYFERNIATNPCGEQGLPAWGVCNLSSVNLAAFVNDEGDFDYEELARITAIGTRFLDNAVDGEKYLYQEIENTQKRERRTGLGTTGLADALIKMKVRYGSKESLEIVRRIYALMRDMAYETSVELAREKGPFPMFEAEKYLQSGFMKTMPEEIREKIRTHGVRNALLLTQAPTGKISLLAGVSSGIEPVFSFKYVQKDRLGERTMYHPLYEAYIKEHGEENIPNYFTVADDLTPEEHVQIQALIQEYTDSSISKTVNAPEVHSIEDVKELYTLAYELGCKGISYMREGSRQGTLERADSKEQEEKKEQQAAVVSDQLPVEMPSPKDWIRPTRMMGATYKIKTPVGTAFITINHEPEGAPYELFINIGKAGTDVQAMAEALGRLVSKYLKSNPYESPKERALMVIDQMKGIGGHRSVGFGPNRIMSLPDAIARALSLDLGLIGSSNVEKKADTVSSERASLLNGNGNGSHEAMQLGLSGEAVEMKQLQVATVKAMEAKEADFCPDCGQAALVREEGCAKCYGCGYSQC